VLRGIDSTPPLLAYDLTDFRPLARTGMKTAKDDPLLTTWQYGLATTLAFTSDAQPRWAKSWAGWAGFSTFWGQAAQVITRKLALNNYQVSVTANQGKAQVEVKAADRLGNPLSTPTLEVRVGGPDGGSASVTLSAEAPGDYLGQFDADKLGSYLVSVVEPGINGQNRVQTAGFSQPYPVELRTFRTNDALMERIRQTTGGRVLSEPGMALTPLRDAGASISELWMLFLAIAVALLPLDIAFRRLALPVPELFAAAWAGVRKLPSRERNRRSAKAATARVSRLHEAKRRAAPKVASAPPPVPAGEAPITVPTPDPTVQPPDPEPTGVAKSASDRLLDAKHRRRNL
jgi:Ca-activated chloride channel family protein